MKDEPTRLVKKAHVRTKQRNERDNKLSGPPPRGQSWTMLDNTTGHTGNTADQPQHTTNNLYTRPSLSTLHTDARETTNIHTYTYMCVRASECAWARQRENKRDARTKKTSHSPPPVAKTRDITTRGVREDGREKERKKERERERMKGRRREEGKKEREVKREKTKTDPPPTKTHDAKHNMGGGKMRRKTETSPSPTLATSKPWGGGQGR